MLNIFKRKSKKNPQDFLTFRERLRDKARGEVVHDVNTELEKTNKKLQDNFNGMLFIFYTSVYAHLKD